jgi:hypothetical protein
VDFLYWSVLVQERWTAALDMYDEAIAALAKGEDSFGS